MEFSHAKLNYHWETLPLATKKALDKLADEGWLKKSKWYLAGGTALALQVGHRSSVDLDFFLPQADFHTGRLVSHFSRKDWHTTVIKEGTIYGALLDAKVSFIAYPFFVPSREFAGYGAVKMLLPKDIAVMKIIAVSQRGRKRDFYDLYWYANSREPLYDVLLRLDRQYPNLEHNYHHIIKSLSYFEDAEQDPEPKIFFKANWMGVKKFFRGEAKKLLKEFKLIV